MATRPRFSKAVVDLVRATNLDALDVSCNGHQAEVDGKRKYAPIARWRDRDSSDRETQLTHHSKWSGFLREAASNAPFLDIILRGSSA